MEGKDRSRSTFDKHYSINYPCSQFMILLYVSSHFPKKDLDFSICILLGISHTYRLQLSLTRFGINLVIFSGAWFFSCGIKAKSSIVREVAMQVSYDSVNFDIKIKPFF